jgi:alpha-tubulin suppressor-like RCC1 family protein
MVLMACLVWSSVLPSSAVMADTLGTPLAWGANEFGQLGDSTGINRLTPVSVSGLSTATAISAGGNDGAADESDPGSHSLALAADGAVFAWGLNDYGQLGDGTITSSSTAVLVSDVTAITAVAAGGYHSLALTSTNTVLAWGRNDYGQLGDNTNDSSNTAVPASGLTDVTAVAAGSYHSVALTSDGTIWAWGDNFYGQLGFDPDVAWESTTPVEVQLPGDIHAVAIAAGGLHSLALASDGTVWAWGYNLDGQLGDGTTTDSYEPVQVTGLGDADILAIAAGAYHSLALDDGGTVWAWGLNGDGQLGNGSTNSSSTAVPVGGLPSGITDVSAGGSHSLALGPGGVVWAWGLNASGQLGDDTTTSSSTPVEVALPVDVIATGISAGESHSLAIGALSLPDGDGIALQLQTGWNMVSVPVLADDMTTASVFEGAVAVYTWDPKMKSYVSPSTIAPCRGYWVAVTTNTTITVTGTPVTFWECDISQGWNMIGSVSEIMAIGALSDDSAGDPLLLSAVYRWNPTGKMYESVSQITPGFGYWLASTDDCIVTLGSPAP